MNVIDIINDVHSDDMNLFVNSLESNKLAIKGLEQVIPKGITKGNSILFYGDTESGKSLLSLDLIRKNKDLMFAYIDTHMQINKDFSNMLLIRSNLMSDILSFFKNIDTNLIDVLILDDLSFLFTENENLRVSEINIFLTELYSICFSKKIVLILLNTLNGKGNMYMSNSNSILYNTTTIIRLQDTVVKDSNINISGVIEKSKYSYRNNIFSLTIERM